MDLVLVGGGHAHVQVLRGWRARPVAGVRLTVIVDRPGAVYSGMVPGFVAGDYSAEDLTIDVVALATAAGARVVLVPAAYIDPALQLVELADGGRVAFDVASLDVGATVAGLDLPGVREHVLATRPIQGFVESLDARLRGAGPRPRVTVVGGGVAGVELAFTLEARLRRAGLAPEVNLLSASPRVLPGMPARLVRWVEREARARNVQIHPSTSASGAEAGAVRIEADGAAKRMACEVAVWATGAAALPFPAQSPLHHDGAGFVRVRETLQAVGFDDIFAAGDCASFEGSRPLPKSGVYAVRQGPVLAANLRARLSARSLEAFRPQRDTLALINLGERRAVGTKWGAVFAGRWVWHWKDRVDRRFVARFRSRAAAV